MPPLLKARKREPVHKLATNVDPPYCAADDWLYTNKIKQFAKIVRTRESRRLLVIKRTFTHAVYKEYIMLSKFYRGYHRHYLARDNHRHTGKFTIAYD